VIAVRALSPGIKVITSISAKPCFVYSKFIDLYQTTLERKMNKTVLITGASSGIGLELARIFAGKSYNLFLVARNEQNLANLATEIKREHQITIHILAKDLSKPNAAQEVFEATKQSNIQIDILINNAGAGLNGRFTENKLQDELDIIQLNIVSLAALSHLYGADMTKRKTGHILNVASTAAFQPGPLMSNYYASKAYVLMLSEGLRSELKDSGVSVTTLCPGPTQTEFFSRAGMGSTFLAKAPHMLTAKQVANIAYQAVQHKKGVVVSGILNKIMVFSTRFAPRFLTASIAKYFNAEHSF
jgi:short-subunit dehydrogenase